MSDAEMVRVTRAIIEKDGKIMAARRSRNMSFPLKWEFPGGKVEEGEGLIECVVRELKEELGTEINITGTLPTYIHHHGSRTFEIIPFVCNINKGNPECIEHEEIKWDKPSELAGLDWAEADFIVYKEYINLINGKRIKSISS